MTKIFKIIALAEGCSYLILLFNMLVFKPAYIDLYKSLLFPIGMSHGVLFIGYLYFAFIIKSKQNWNTRDFLSVILASLIPFGTFFIEKRYLKNA